MRITSLFGLAIFLLLAMGMVTQTQAQAGQTNPFVKNDHVVKQLAPAEQVQPGIAQDLIAKLVESQRALNGLIANLVRAVQPGGEAFNPMALFTLLGLAFLYGIIHALGPGHGKSLAGSFFLTRPARIRHGIELGYWLALFHAVIAIGLVWLLSSVLRLSITGGTETVSWWLGTVSYSLVMAIGVWMLLDAAIQLGSGGVRHLHIHLGAHEHKPVEHEYTHAEHEHSHNHAEHNHAHHQSAPAIQVALDPAPATQGSEIMVKSRELMALGFLSAVVPCPGAVGIMVFSAGANAVAVGALAVASLSVGMGLTSSVAGITGILARKGVLRAANRVMPLSVRRFGGIVRIVGSACFALLGFLLLIAQF